ncbi:MAG: DegV family protein [Oscillospiraceae bacterium]
MKIKITADSTCDLSPEILEKYKISISPLTVSLGDDSFKDSIDIHPKDIYNYFEKTSMVPKTSAVNVGDYEDFFSPFIKKGYTIIHINISSGFSSSYQNALIAAENLGNIFVVDSKNLSTGSALLVLTAVTMAKKGESPQNIVEKLEDMATKVEASFVIDTLTYLHKGGRCSTIAALGANLLKLKPCIEVIDGGMTVGKKYRGSIENVVLKYIEERLKDREDIDYERIFVTHTGCSKAVVNSAIKTIVALQPKFKEIIETVAGCTITSHCGPNTLGILFVRTNKDKIKK